MKGREGAVSIEVLTGILVVITGFYA